MLDISYNLGYNCHNEEARATCISKGRRILLTILNLGISEMARKLSNLLGVQAP